MIYSGFQSTNATGTINDGQRHKVELAVHKTLANQYVYRTQNVRSDREVVVEEVQVRPAADVAVAGLVGPWRVERDRVF